MKSTEYITVNFELQPTHTYTDLERLFHRVNYFGMQGYELVDVRASLTRDNKDGHSFEYVTLKLKKENEK